MRPTARRIICQSQSLNIFLPADVHKRDLHQIHMMAWKKGVKTLYYCRSLSIQRADVVSSDALSVPLGDHALASPRMTPPLSTVGLPAGGTNNEYEECLSCQYEREASSQGKTVIPSVARDSSHAFSTILAVRSGMHRVLKCASWHRRWAAAADRREQATSLDFGKLIYKPFHYPGYDAGPMQQRLHRLRQEAPWPTT